MFIVRAKYNVFAYFLNDLAELGQSIYKPVQSVYKPSQIQHDSCRAHGRQRSIDRISSVLARHPQATETLGDSGP